MNQAKFINLLTICSVVILDQITKLWVLKNLTDGRVINLVPGLLELVFRKNTGIAFSMFDAYPQVLSVVVSIIITFLLYQIIFSKTINLGMACIIGGGIGNLVDRFTRGFVIDFINPVFVDFAVFNVADAFLNIGVTLIIIEQLYSMAKESKV